MRTTRTHSSASPHSRGPTPEGELIVAESDDELIAALSLRTGQAVADPFHVTFDLVKLLQVRAAQLDRLAA
jgi:hypothetical protein